MDEERQRVAAEIPAGEGDGYRVLTYPDHSEWVALQWTDDLAAGYVIDGDGVHHDLGSGWTCPFERATWDQIKAAMDAAFAKEGDDDGK